MAPDRDPLSLLIFILCLEPLAVAIHSHPDIKGILMQQNEYKLSLLVDDNLLRITDPLLFLPSLHDLLSNFGSLSSYKANTFKTEALLILLPLILYSPYNKSISTAGALNLLNTWAYS